jgi:hypothetical protein
MEIATAKAAVLPQSMGRPFWLQPVAEKRRALTKRLVSTYYIQCYCDKRTLTTSLRLVRTYCMCILSAHLLRVYIYYMCMVQQLSSLLASCCST